MPNVMDSGTRSQAEICALLNEFLYLGYVDASDGDTVREILEKIKRNPDLYEKQFQSDEFDILEANLDTIGDYQIDCQSWNNSQFDGTYACTFKDPDSGKIYVTYRGTGDGEWPDNGLGMTQVSTTQQEKAAEYFDYVAEHIGLNESDHVIITGHSKGGNKAQYVTINSRYRDYIDECFSLDGQGFSPEAIAYFKEKYGEDYEEAIRKMVSVCGEDDFVNPLGVKVIPDDRTYYIDTPREDTDFVACHDLKYFFSYFDEDGEVRFGKEMNPETDRGLVSINAMNISNDLMKLPPEERNEVSLFIMHMMERNEGNPIGLNGETLTVEHVIGFIKEGVPEILYTLLFTKDGQEFLKKYGPEFLEKAYQEMGPIKFVAYGTVIIHYLPVIASIAVGAYLLAHLTDAMMNLIKKIEEISKSLKMYFEKICEDARLLYESWLVGRKVVNPAANYDPGNTISVNPDKLRRIAEQLSRVHRKIQQLDGDLDRLRQNQEWYEIVDKIRTGAIDFLYVGYDSNLASCINYLNQAATILETTESRIKGIASQM